jgi:hypothetical protein
VRLLWPGFLEQVIRRALSTPGATGGALHLTRVTGRLHLEWQAREIHAWDRDMPAERQAELFCEQTIGDADAALTTLFRILPEIDAIVVQVVEPWPAGRVILAGTVLRETVLGSSLPSSPRMRLKMYGLRYEIVAGHLEPLDDAPPAARE